MDRAGFHSRRHHTPGPSRPGAMPPHLANDWGNASSIYFEGREARKALDGARLSVAEVLGCKPNDVVFTSGGSESDNAAIRGAAFASMRAPAQP